MPGRPGVPQVVPREILDLRPRQRALKCALDLGDGAAAVWEHPGFVWRVDVLPALDGGLARLLLRTEGCDRDLRQRDTDRLLRLGLVRMDPCDLARQIDLLPGQVGGIALPHARGDRKSRQVQQVVGQLRLQPLPFLLREPSDTARTFLDSRHHRHLVDPPGVLGDLQDGADQVAVAVERCPGLIGQDGPDRVRIDRRQRRVGLVPRQRLKPPAVRFAPFAGLQPGDRRVLPAMETTFGSAGTELGGDGNGSDISRRIFDHADVHGLSVLVADLGHESGSDEPPVRHHHAEQRRFDRRRLRAG